MSGLVWILSDVVVTIKSKMAAIYRIYIHNNVYVRLYFRLMVVIFDFPVAMTSENIHAGLTVLLDLENGGSRRKFVGITLKHEISLTSGLTAAILVLCGRGL